MPFDQDHWRHPRETIASKFASNDIGYATHGAQQALYALKMLDLRPSECRDKTMLDCGCGTGRMARVLAFQFARVIGYDPVVECIQTAQVECPDLAIPNVFFTSDPAQIPQVDYAVCINVVEHLTTPEAVKVLNIMESRLRPGGRYVLWYSIQQNTAALDHRLTVAMRNEDQAIAGNGQRTINVRVFHT